LSEAHAAAAFLKSPPNGSFTCWKNESMSQRDFSTCAIFLCRSLTRTYLLHGLFLEPTETTWCGSGRLAVGDGDGFIFVSPEYNYGPPAVLKNALDWLYVEWNRKPAAFGSYGGVGGARSVQQLREIAIELQMAPIRSSVHFPMATLFTHFQGGDVETALAEHDRTGNLLIDDLLWWASSLKSARLAT
jgi:hypothetical protein